MAKWGKISARGNVEDRRSNTIKTIGLGSFGLVGVIIYFALLFFRGDNGLKVLSQLQDLQPVNNVQQTAQFQGLDEYEEFSSTVLGSTNEVWTELFKPNNYEEPKLVLFRDATKSACGIASSKVGPHYCPADKTIYIDETFYDVLVEQFEAKGGDVAEAYVLAHEVGHHVQNLLGILGDVTNQQQQNPDDANDYSVNLELQADCFAGVWAHSLNKEGIFSPNEISEAINAAEAVGDDRIQEKVNGQINKEDWTHGSSQQRAEWFTRGYNTGNPKTCNTFDQ